MIDVVFFIANNKEFFAIMIAFLAIIVPFIQYLNTKSIEQSQKNQESFHEKMLKKLTNQEGKVGLEEQVAVIFDLRNYPQYYSVTSRMLHDCNKRWKLERKTKPHFAALVKEATETLKYLESNFFQRFLLRIKDRYI